LTDYYGYSQVSFQALDTPKWLPIIEKDLCLFPCWCLPIEMAEGDFNYHLRIRRHSAASWVADHCGNTVGHADLGHHTFGNMLLSCV